MHDFRDSPLTVEEVRVLGALIEKAMTTPEYYPLTLKALTAACNQKNNRNPVVSYDERTVLKAVERLRERKLAVLVYKAGARAPKYEHRLDEALDLSELQTALLCELLLRGPQTTAELRSRSERMHPAGTEMEVEDALRELSRRDPPLVTLLPREPRRRERRWMHLLCGQTASGEEDNTETAPAEPPSIIADEAFRLQRLEERVSTLEQELQRLTEEIKALRDLLE